MSTASPAAPTAPCKLATTIYEINRTARIKRSIELLREIRAAVYAEFGDLPNIETHVAHAVSLYCTDEVCGELIALQVSQ